MAAHTTEKVMQARIMHEGGWSLAFIARKLGVAKTTVACWTDPDYAEHRRKQISANQRRRRAGNAQAPYVGRTNEAKIARIQALREVGLSHTSIGRVVGLDFGEEPWSRERIELVLREGRVPRRYTRKVTA